MNITEVNDLELQVEHLIRATERLKAENFALRHKLANHDRERHRLQDKNHQATVKIKRIMNQLKEELP